MTLLRAKHRVAIREAVVASANSTQSSRVVGGLRSGQPALQTRLERELRRALDHLGERTAQAASVAGSHEWDAATIEHIIGLAALGKFTTQVLEPIGQENAALTAEMTMRVLDREDVIVSERDKVASRVMAEGGRRMGLVDITGDTRSALLRVLDDARLQGLNPRDAAKLIQREVPAGRFVNAGAKYRSQLIARTEILHAQRYATLESYRGAPQVRAVLAYDGESDEECAARDGETFTFDQAEYEMDSTHPNCVLAFGPVV